MRIKQWLRGKVDGFLLRLMRPVLDRYLRGSLDDMLRHIDSHKGALDQHAKRHADRLEDKIRSVMAIDTPFHGDAGMIVVVARMASGRDLVKVIDLSPRMSPAALKDMVHLLERSFAARPEFVDSHSMAEVEYLRGGPRRHARSVNDAMLDPTFKYHQG